MHMGIGCIILATEIPGMTASEIMCLNGMHPASSHSCTYSTTMRLIIHTCFHPLM